MIVFDFRRGPLLTIYLRVDDPEGLDPSTWTVAMRLKAATSTCSLPPEDSPDVGVFNVEFRPAEDAEAKDIFAASIDMTGKAMGLYVTDGAIYDESDTLFLVTEPQYVRLNQSVTPP